MYLHKVTPNEITPLDQETGRDSTLNFASDGVVPETIIPTLPDSALGPAADKAVSAAFPPAIPVASANASAQIGIVASKKVGNAVVRNLVRRRIKEVFRLHPDCLAGWKAVIIVFPSAARASYSALEKDLLKNLQKAQQAVGRPKSSVTTLHQNSPRK